MITSESLQTPGLSEQITQLLAGVDRSSGSSDWLKALFLTGGYDAMVNYECLIISANQELEACGEETLYAVYPYDGLSIADSPLGYVDNGDTEKEQAFLDLQEYLLSDEVQNEIQRTGYEGVSAEEAGADALLDEEIQRLAWENHGFRTEVSGTGVDEDHFGVPHLAAEITQVTAMPSYAAMEKIIAALS